MLSRPVDLSDVTLATHLLEGWGIAAEDIEYMAVGFGSHHWSVGEGQRRWFVTVDDLVAKVHGLDDSHDAVFNRLRAALTAARAIADQGLEFVVAPLLTADADVVRRADGRYAVAVYPFVDGTTYPYGDFQTVEHRDTVLAMVARLHGVADPATIGAVPDDLVVPRRADLSMAIDALGQQWDSGPYGDRARRLLDRHATAVERLFEHYDLLAAVLADRPERTVLTHGEPHQANTVGTSDGWLIVDWDTTSIAAPERDLWMMATVDPAVVDAYQAKTGRKVLADGLDCYRLWWDLCEICGYVTLLRNAHDDTDDIRASWSNLQHYLDPASRWPQLV